MVATIASDRQIFKNWIVNKLVWFNVLIDSSDNAAEVPWSWIVWILVRVRGRVGGARMKAFCFWISVKNNSSNSIFFCDPHRTCSLHPNRQRGRTHRLPYPIQCDVVCVCVPFVYRTYYCSCLFGFFSVFPGLSLFRHKISQKGNEMLVTSCEYQLTGVTGSQNPKA